LPRPPYRPPYTLSLHDALPIFGSDSLGSPEVFAGRRSWPHWNWSVFGGISDVHAYQVGLWVWAGAALFLLLGQWARVAALTAWIDRKSTRLNSSHVASSYAVFC